MSNSKRRVSRSIRSIDLSVSEPEAVNASESEPAKRSAIKLMLGYLKRNWWATAIIAFLSLGCLGAGLKFLEEDAQRQKLLPATERSSLNQVNPFASAPLPTPAVQLSKEYVYAGSRLLAVEDANANAAPPSDLAIWRPSTGVWWVMNGATGGIVNYQWGSTSTTNPDETAPGDYDGDGKTDFAVFRPSNGQWYIVFSSTGGIWNFSLGASGDKPAPADFDGDGRTDPALYRASTQTWYVQGSSVGYYSPSWQGVSGDVAAPADYDGDGKADLAVWRSGDLSFHAVNSSGSGSQTTYSIGHSGVSASGDYDGDGKADPAIFDGGSGYWYIRKSTTNSVYTFPQTWGTGTDVPVQNDYDADGKVDVAVWRDSNGTWYIINSHDGSIRQQGWGQSGDKPVPAYYRR